MRASCIQRFEDLYLSDLPKDREEWVSKDSITLQVRQDVRISPAQPPSQSRTPSKPTDAMLNGKVPKGPTSSFHLWLRCHKPLGRARAANNCRMPALPPMHSQAVRTLSFSVNIVYPLWTQSSEWHLYMLGLMTV